MSIRLTDLSFAYPGSRIEVLRAITAEFEPGRVTLITGRLGAGCSTMLLAAAGLAPHATGGVRHGSVLTLGVDPASPEGRRSLAGRVGLLLPTPWTQLSGMSYTVREEVAFGPANLGWERGRIEEAVSRSLALVGVGSLAARDPRTLSGGELQRVMLAAVLVMDPEVLLLDEPTLELDPEGARLAYRLLPDLARDRTVVIASTDVDRAVEVADRVLLLREGAVVADGPPEQVLGEAEPVAAGCSTTVADVLRRAGMPPRYPLTVGAAVRRLGR